MKQHCLLGMVPAVIARVLPRRFWLIRIMSRMARGLSKTIFPFMMRGSVAANISLERVQFTMAVLFVWPNPYLARSRCGWLLFGLTSPRRVVKPWPVSRAFPLGQARRSLSCCPRF